MRTTALILLLCALAVPRQALAQEPPSGREYAVWSALVDSVLASPRVSRVVLGDQTVAGDRFRARGPFEQRSLIGRRDTTPLPAELLEAFARANGGAAGLDPARFHTRIRVQVASRAGRHNVPKAGDDRAWMEMHDGGYPGSPGVARLSRVGFTGDGKTALVFMNLYCGGLCGQETYYVLTLAGDNRWTLTRQYVVSQS